MPIKSGGGVNKEFSAYRTADQVIPTSADTKIQLNNERFDPDGVFDSAVNYRYDPKEEGYYLVTSTVMIIQLQTGRFWQLNLYRNGAQHANFGRQWSASNSSELAVSGSAVVYLDGNDFLEMWMYHNHGANRNIQGTIVDCIFTGCLLKAI